MQETIMDGHILTSPTGCPYHLSQKRIDKYANGLYIITTMKPLQKRLLDNCLNVGNCWEWQGALKNGYGHIMVGSRTNNSRKTISTHRASYIAFKGKIHKGKWVLHTCDNRKCIRPAHLYLGNRADNVRDMIERGRLNTNFGEKCGNSILTDRKVIEMRKERANKKTSYRILAKKYGLKSHKSTIQICKGELWKHILPTPPEASND